MNGEQNMADESIVCKHCGVELVVSEGDTCRWCKEGGTGNPGGAASAEHEDPQRGGAG